MKIVIIEDELLTAQDITGILIQLPGNIEVTKILQSVSEAVQYFEQNEQPDLIFCDIQLGDGHSFDIFKSVQIEAPVVFCTAYDEYALEAFRNNGIDYILKPFSRITIKNAIEKYKNLRSQLTGNRIDFDAVLAVIREGYNNYQKSSSILINWKDKIIPVKINDIALFNIEYKTTQLVTFDNQKYFINQTLDELSEVCGSGFYRANRQYLINRSSVTEALQYFARKLVLKLKVDGKYEIIISKNKVPDFLRWLES
ncbi:MAG: response regulator transcription factor [Chitinophagaceae bacterium]|nr:response regulator transcription factor [Chitinophagaceae bacterium]